MLLLGGCEAGKLIDQVVFASFGTPQGSCSAGFTKDKSCDDGAVKSFPGHFTLSKLKILPRQARDTHIRKAAKNDVPAGNTTAIVTQLCVGKASCKVTASVITFGGNDPCANTLK